MNNKLLGIIIAVIVIVCVGFILAGYLSDSSETKIINATNNTTNITNNTTVAVEKITKEKSTNSNQGPNGEFGYCAVCGAPLTEAEANDEYTQGKVCHSCATNPYFQTEEGAQYANQKLEEAYPDRYNGISDEYMEENY